MERSTDARSPATSTDGKPTNLDSNQAAAASAQQPNTPSHECTVPCTGQQIGQENGRRGGYNHRICPRPARRWPPFRRPLSHIISGLDLRKHDKSGQKSGRRMGHERTFANHISPPAPPPRLPSMPPPFSSFTVSLPTHSWAQTCANTTNQGRNQGAERARVRRARTRGGRRRRGRNGHARARSRSSAASSRRPLVSPARIDLWRARTAATCPWPPGSFWMRTLSCERSD